MARDAERLVALESGMAAMKVRLERAVARLAGGAVHVPIRLARTVLHYTGSYPAIGPTFPIMFVDGGFDEDVAEIPFYANRGVADEEQRWVCNLNGTVIPVNTVILVAHWNDRWWTFHTTGGPGGSGGATWVNWWQGVSLSNEQIVYAYQESGIKTLDLSVSPAESPASFNKIPGIGPPLEVVRNAPSDTWQFGHQGIYSFSAQFRLEVTGTKQRVDIQFGLAKGPTDADTDWLPGDIAVIQDIEDGERMSYHYESTQLLEPNNDGPPDTGLMFHVRADLDHSVDNPSAEIRLTPYWLRIIQHENWKDAVRGS